MPIPTASANSNIAFSTLQAEFGGSSPISFSEFYRNASNTGAYLQDNDFVVGDPVTTINLSGYPDPIAILNATYPGVADKYRTRDTSTGNIWIKSSGTWVNVGGDSRPENLASNSNVPTSGQIKISNFSNTRRYQRVDDNISALSTQPLVTSFSSIFGGGIVRSRYHLAVKSFSLPFATATRIRIPAITIQIRGSYNSGGWFGDDDFSGIGNPGITIRDANNTEVGSSINITHSEDTGLYYANYWYTVTLPEITATLGVGTHTIYYFVEAYYDPDAGPTYWESPGASISYATI